MDATFIIIIALMAVLGGALIAGGVVAYRGSTSVGARVLAAAAVGAGIVIWSLILFVVPTSVTTQG